MATCATKMAKEKKQESVCEICQTHALNTMMGMIMCKPGKLAPSGNDWGRVDLTARERAEVVHQLSGKTEKLKNIEIYGENKLDQQAGLTRRMCICSHCHGEKFRVQVQGFPY